MSVAVDQHVEKTTAALDVLGELHALDTPDLPAFQSLASRILPYQPNWSAILLASADGRMIEGVPDRVDGEARVAGTAWAQATAAARSFTVSNLFEVPGATGRFVIVATPVIRQGRVISVLGARVRSESFSALLRQQQGPPNGAVALVGRDHRVVARTRQEADYIGTPVNQTLMDLSQRTLEASFRVLSRDGTPTYAAFSRSPRT